MDEIFVNVEYEGPDKFNISTSPTGPTSSERRRHGAVVLSLSLLSVFLLAGLIGLGVHYYGSAAEFSSVKANLTERLQISDNTFLSLTEERDQLNFTLTEVTNQRDTFRNLSECKKLCPKGWKMFSCSCYLLSTKSGTWYKGREDCRGRGADLVIIDSTEEQKFLIGLTSDAMWIGLTDKEEEGVWKWVDGTPLTLSYWRPPEPNNGGDDPRIGEEDCAQIRDAEKRKWNDLACGTSLKWTCEMRAS